MNKCIWPLVLVLLVVQACSQSPWLSGTIKNTQNSEWQPKVYLIRPNSYKEMGQSFVGEVLDSTNINPDGSFEFTGTPKLNEPTFLQVAVQKLGDRYPNRLLNENPQTDNYFPLLVDPDVPLVINASIDRFQASFSIQDPSLVNKEILDLRNVRLAAYEKYKQSNAMKTASDEQLLDRERALLDYQLEILDYTDVLQEPISALVAIKWASPEGDFERLPEALFKQAQKWSSIAPDYPWVQELVETADKSQLPMMLGDTIPDLILPTQTEDNISLHDFLTGKKLVVLDVWASWCAPCRVENRNILVPLWDTYHSKGFGILAYGLESNKTAWEKAIEKDGAFRWTHTSHLQGDQNPLMDALRLRTIPANFILDEKGKILAKNLHGAELEVFVDEYMGSH